MRFFFPDSQDLVDPSFDFATEDRSVHRDRHRSYRYAHEVFDSPPYDGMLVSRAIVEGKGMEGGRYSAAQRFALLRRGVREYFRLTGTPLLTMGDCGAFAYVAEPAPTVTIDEVVEFYDSCGFDLGVSIDHIILAYAPQMDEALPGIDAVPDDWRTRQRITLEMARDFLARHAASRLRFTPIGAAQGWSPRSYADSVKQLQRMGYRRVGLGGMVPLKTVEIIQALEAVAAVRHPETQLHLFGISRPEHALAFREYGVTSIDSTSPLRQSFKDDRDNYYAPARTYTALRVPQVGENAKLKKRIASGELDQGEALRLERTCLEALGRYDRGEAGVEVPLLALREYDALHDGRKDRTAAYRETLADRPWKDCPCEVCRALGIHVVIFRGAERNRRRGFHNLFVTYRRLHQELARVPAG
ncbi:MAG: tRNA-guanine transglycosylase DpdA [Gemmataceae bacterium]